MHYATSDGDGNKKGFRQGGEQAAGGQKGTDYQKRYDELVSRYEAVKDRSSPSRRDMQNLSIWTALSKHLLRRVGR